MNVALHPGIKRKNEGKNDENMYYMIGLKKETVSNNTNSDICTV